MNIKTLNKEQEKQWIECIKDDKEEFLLRLITMLNSSGNLKIKLSNKLLSLIFIEEFECENNGNAEYKIVKSRIVNNVFDCKFFDFSNFEYNNLELDQNTVDFMAKNGIVIDLNRVYNKDLKKLTLKDCIIEGSFDNVSLESTVLVNNKTKNGSAIRINPQTIRNKSFVNCHIEDVEFTGEFDECNIKGITLINNKNVIINPQRIVNKNLCNVTIEGAQFKETLNGCSIKNSNIVKSSGLKIDGISVKIFVGIGQFSIKNVSYYIKNDDDFNALYLDSLHFIEENDTIICNLKYKEKLQKKYPKCSYEILPSRFDEVLDNTFSSSLYLNNNQDTSLEKQKKKNILGRFRK